MKTSIRKALIPTAAALAVAVPTILAGPALAGEGDAADARYEAYIAQEAKANAASRASNQAAKQITRVGATDSSALYAENGTKRFYLDVSPAQEQHYRGM